MINYGMSWKLVVNYVQVWSIVSYYVYMSLFQDDSLYNMYIYICINTYNHSYVK